MINGLDKLRSFMAKSQMLGGTGFLNLVTRTDYAVGLVNFL